jgi:hypothetical protein
MRATVYAEQQIKRLQIIGKLACSVPIDQEKKHHAKSDKIGKEKKREKR